MPGGLESYQLGCLLADAEKVPLSTKKLSEIKHACYPWHFLFERAIYTPPRYIYASEYPDHSLGFLLSALQTRSTSIDFLAEWESLLDTSSLPPTVHDLNEETLVPFDKTGVAETTDEDLARLGMGTEDAEEIRQFDRQRLFERRISRMLVIDVRDEPVATPAPPRR